MALRTEVLATTALNNKRRREGFLKSLRSSPLLRSKQLIVGAVMLLFFVVLALIGPTIAPYDPTQMSDASNQPPSAEHWLGTTQTGQDVLSQVLQGAQSTLLVGFLAGAISCVLAIIIGVAAGYLGGFSDELLSMLSNIFLVIPGLPLVIVLAAYLPQSGPLAIAAVIALTGWAWGARVLRAQTMSIRSRDYVQAARSTGEGAFRIILAEILPNVSAIVASSFLMSVISAILTMAGLNFLGLGDLASWSWGSMLFFAQNDGAFAVGAWWWFVPPGLFIALVGTSLALINFGLDEYMNPRLRSAANALQDGAMDEVVRAASGKTGIPASKDVVLEMKNLAVDYGAGENAVHAVDGISLDLRRGEVLGLAGESGSGKSTLAFAANRLLRAPGRVVGGDVIYHPENGEAVDVFAMNDAELKEFRWQEMSIVFQSAMNVLNPVMDIGTQLTDAIKAHRPGVTKQELRERAAELLTTVGIPTDRVKSYPHELSGGMRQRAVIAMALALEPRIVVLDEPTTALDVVTQRDIMEQLSALREKFGFSIIFITHDLSLLLEMADRIAVMYAGRVVEVASAQELYHNPKHPYTKGLLASFPALHGPQSELSGIPGSPPSMHNVPTGCAFHPRCPVAIDRCKTGPIPLLLRPPQGDENALVSCWLQQADALVTEGERQ